MNDDEKKPLAGQGDAEASEGISEQEDAKVNVSVNSKSNDEDGKVDNEKQTDSDLEDLKKADAIDITAALKDKKNDGATDIAESTESEEEVSEEERELGRIEGISATESALDGGKSVDDMPVVAEETDDLDIMTAPVDLEKEKSSQDEAKNPLVEALRKQEQAKEAPKKSKTGFVAALLGVLLVAALGGAGYFYAQVADVNSQLASTQTELADAQTKNNSLNTELKKAVAEQQAVESQSSYRTIEGFGVRFKATDATKAIVFGYTVASADASADAVAMSTKPLVKLSVGSGSTATYPCAFTGNVPTIARYTADVKIGTSTASKVGKKIGDAYYVYTAPAAACATTEVAAQAVRDTAAKAIYDSLEAAPASVATSAQTGTSTKTNK